MKACPCGSGRGFDECCAPFIEGREFPPTAEALMRARYAAHSQGQFDYLRASTVAEARDEVDWKELEEWSSTVSWEGLEILGTEKGTENDQQGIVAFLARFSYEGTPQEHRERSLFRRDADGNWAYVDGEIERPEPVRREQPKIGRNEACPCGSGKKYKKCCGAA